MLKQKTSKKEFRRGKRIKKKSEKLKDYVYLTYKESITGTDKDKWKKIIEEKKKSLEENQTWMIVDRSKAKGKRILNNKWIFKVKDEQKI